MIFITKYDDINHRISLLFFCSYLYEYNIILSYNVTAEFMLNLVSRTGVERN